AETDQLRLHTAEAYLALNLYDEAALIYDQVTALVELSGQAHYHAVALAGRGAALAALQRWDEASGALEQAAEQHDRVGNVPLATASRVELAAVLAHRGDRDAAVDLLRRLRGDTGDDRYRVARVYVLLGLSDVAEPVEASAALVEAADLVHRLGLPPLRFRVDSRLGALRRRQGRLVEARDLLQRAADEADDQRALLPSQLTRTSFLRDKTRTFDELVALHLDLEPDSADAAFLASERAKGRALLDLVSTTATPGAPVAEMLDSAVARVLDDEGLDSVCTTAEAIRWASERDADVINLSLGTAADSELLEDAVEDAEEDDVVVVCLWGQRQPVPAAVAGSRRGRRRCGRCDAHRPALTLHQLRALGRRRRPRPGHHQLLPATGLCAVGRHVDGRAVRRRPGGAAAGAEAGRRCRDAGGADQADRRTGRRRPRSRTHRPGREPPTPVTVLKPAGQPGLVRLAARRPERPARRSAV
ncbi:MAG TPA: hypothetical protein VGP51_03870, partial [Nocardioidaceae bacterium]|nr:hypothetical protein [Nocardioidaceae bacterium]